MGNFNKYNDRSLSQLLQESAEILAEEFPPGGPSTEAPPPPPAAGGSEMPPDEADLDAGPPGEGDEGAADNTPAGICNQIQDLLDQLRAQVGGGEESDLDTTSSDIPGRDEEDISAPATPPPVESRKRPAVAKK